MAGGLLDWITDLSGGMSFPPGMGGPMDAPVGPSASSMTPPAPQAPPMTGPTGQPAADPASSLDPSTSDIGGGLTTGRMPNVPMPQPRPAGADAEPAPAPQPTPSAQPPGNPMQLTPSAPSAPDTSYDGMRGQVGPIGRALGLDGGGERKLFGSLAAGLKSVGDNSSKPGLAAFSGSAGSALEGGNKADQTEYDDKIKALTQAVAYQKAGDDAAYKTAYVKYLGASLKNKTDAAASGKAAWNKPDSQKFIDASHALAADPEIKASQKILDAATKSGDPAEVTKAQAAHSALVAQKRVDYIRGVGLDPKNYAAQAANPPGGAQNPHTFTGDPAAVQKQFDTYVKPGDYYVNPRDGKVYVRKAGSGSGGESSSGASSPPAPSNPMKPGNPPASSDDED